jgi:cysteine desulfuration protein SufE|tara:strand:+ start:118 stop:513 length:396 start_codon:yes stop_codon:yes gene_type:complete
MLKNKIDEIKEILESFPDSQMGLHYLVDLGKESQENYPEEDRVEENFIHGCTSNAWIKLLNKDPIQINTVSDSLIISGLLYLLEEVFNGEPKSSIDSYSGQDLIDGLGLDGHISSQRLRGFAEAVRMMKDE